MSFCDQRTDFVLVPMQKDPNSKYHKQINECERIFNELASILNSHGLEGSKLIGNFQDAELYKSALAIEAAYLQGLKDGLASDSTTAIVLGGLFDEKFKKEAC